MTGWCRWGGRLAIGLVVAVASSGPVIAAPVGDERALPERVDQAAIDRGEVGLDRLIEIGRAWFLAKFTVAEGAARSRCWRAK